MTWDALVSSETRRNTLRTEHGHAQAAAETIALRRIGDRYAHASYKQGHRTGFWDGIEYAIQLFNRRTDTP